MEYPPAPQRSALMSSQGRALALPVLLISFVSLCFVVANYRLTVVANRPNLASYGLQVNLNAKPPHLEVGFNNVGKITARRGVATLFSLTQAAAAPEKIGSTPIVGAGTNIFAGFGSSARFDSQSVEAAAFFLVCAVYFDESGTQYEQAFKFERGSITPPSDVKYDEPAPTNLEICGGS